ncbi:MAG: hypothetical protein HY300_14005 [Verrucomicrobia bacterium]|nr:hypothetical protein [Verrucomicrobiota bacterium]
MKNSVATKMQAGFFLMMALGLALTGCGRKAPEPGPKTDASKSRGVSIENLIGNSGTPESAPPAAAPTSEAAPAPPVPAGSAADDKNAPPAPDTEDIILKGGELATPEVIKAYNTVLMINFFGRSDAPRTLEQLQKWPNLPALPKPPQGKRIVYDANTKTIRVE